MRSGNLHYREERGVVAIFFLIFGVVLAGALAYFAYRAPQTQAAGVSLRLHADEICMEIASYPRTQQEAIDLFTARVAEKQQVLGDVDITAAYLVAPSMPDDATVFPLGGGTGSASIDDCSGGSPFTITPQVVDLTAAGCGLEAPSPCLLIRDACYSDGSFAPLSEKYPPEILYQTLNAGNSYICELEGTRTFQNLTGFMNTTSDTVVGRSVVWRRPRNIDFEMYNPVAADENSVIDSLPNLTIIVSPYGKTQRPSQDPRFQMVDNLSGYDPIAEGATVFTGAPLADGSIDPYTGAVVDTSDGIPDDPYSEEITTGPLGGGPGDANGMDDDGDTLLPPGDETFIPRLPGIPVGTPSHEELLTSCLNPAVAMRNAFLYHLLSLAVRDGHFRKNTQLLLAQPRHRIQRSNHYNAPTVLWPLGRDLALDDARTASIGLDLPFIHYFGAVDGDSDDPDNSGSDNLKVYLDDTDSRYGGHRLGSFLGSEPEADKRRQGWLQPFVKKDAAGVYEALDGRTSMSDVQYLTLLAGQLRYCQGLFAPSAGTEYGVSAGFVVDPYNPHTPLDPPSNGAFDPAAQFHTAPGGYFLRSNGLNPSGQWSADWTGSDPWVPGGIRRDHMTAFSLVSALGMPQLCPTVGTDVAGVTPFSDGNAPDCLKAGVGAEASDLRGDLLGALHSLSSTTVRHPYADQEIVGSTMLASSFPGLWRINQGYQFWSDQTVDVNGSPEYPHPFRPFEFSAAAPYTQSNAFNNNEVPADPSRGDQIIVIVTHQPLLQDEFLSMQALITGQFSQDGGGNLQQDDVAALEDLSNEMIIVVYIPLYDSQANAEDREQEWATALLGPTDNSSTSNQFSDRFVLYLGPYQGTFLDPDGDDDFSDAFYNSGNDWQDYRDFWHDMMRDSEDDTFSGDYPGGNIADRAKVVWSVITKGEIKF